MKRYGPILAFVLAAAISQGRAVSQHSPARLKHLRIDHQRREVILDAEVCLRSGPLELLVCKWNTKEHESILHTKASAADLHAALLSLGLTQGKPARWTPAGDNGQAVFAPPMGAQLAITLRWKDQAGRLRQASAGEWLSRADADNAAPPSVWIFVGSDILPNGRYWADAEGDVISVANFASSVIDVPFESTAQNNLLYFTANTKAIPPLGTPVEVVVSPLPGTRKSPHARVMLEIDSLGRVSLDGRTMSPTDLENWARAYLSRHSKGCVVLRIEAEAMVYYVQQARTALAMGGVTDVEEQPLPPSQPILPRTPGQAKESLRQWEHRFANAHEFIRDPAEVAGELLDMIERRKDELARLNALWSEYAEHLRVLKRRYQASTRPAADTPPKRQP